MHGTSSRPSKCAASTRPWPAIMPSSSSISTGFVKPNSRMLVDQHRVRKTELPDAACDLRDLRIGVRAGVAGIGDQRLDAAPHHDELAGPGRRRARFPRARGRAGARYRWGSVPMGPRNMAAF